MHGPDLNATKSALDPKLYRQIVLPNGLRCCLIQDTIAMQEFSNIGDICRNEDDSCSSGSSSNINNDGGYADEDKKEELSDDDDCDQDSGETSLRDAAVAILVGAGSAYDPLSCQGLAHFLEHLCFMGSEKYPGENDYESFVARHGGSDNAFTEWEYTVYSLEIPQPYLWPALDRLAQFFIAPLLLESAVDRELLSIESEFQLHANSDNTRRQQLLCSTFRPDHPMAKFGWGNLQSLREIPNHLGVDPMQELRDFYNRYYYAANMRLAIIGAYTLDQMEAKVKTMFSSVPALPRSLGSEPLPVQPEEISSWNGTYSSPLRDAGMPLPSNDSGSLPKVYRIVPVKERHVLVFSWPMPSQFQNWRSKPAEYLAHILGHEAEGSLFAYLRRKRWATSCTAGFGEDGAEHASSHAIFSLSFSLTEAGSRNWRHIVETVYEYVGILQHYSRIGWPEEIFDELQQVHHLSYQFASEANPDDVVEHVVENMAPHVLLPPERVLDGSSLFFEFAGKLVEDLLQNYFTPHNGRIDITSSSFGRAHDFPCDPTAGPLAPENMRPTITPLEDPDEFIAELAGPPYIEPMFQTRFWCHTVNESWLTRLVQLAKPRPPTTELGLPPRNPFVPASLELKALPDHDSRHPLLSSSIKLCTTVGKSKEWFPAMVLRYHRVNNLVLLYYEDGVEEWHKLDQGEVHFSPERISGKGFEGTMDDKAIKYRIRSLSHNGRPRQWILGDNTDSIAFPPIPPASKTDRLPRELCSTNQLRMWWMQDRYFHRPIADLRIEIICKNANLSPLHRACAELVVTLCNDELTEKAYLADCCELYVNMSAQDNGFSIRVHGFDNKLHNLLESVLGLLLSFRMSTGGLPDVFEDERFDYCLEVLRRGYKNSGMSSGKLASIVRILALRPNHWSSYQKLIAVDNISIALFTQTVLDIMESLAAECLFHGNIDRSVAEQVRNSITDLLQKAQNQGLPRKNYPRHSVLRIPPTSTILVQAKDPKEPNTAVEMYIQVGKDNIKERVLIDLLVEVIDEPFFDQIRTKDQFGYEVECGSRWTYGITGIAFRIISSRKSAQEATERIEQFLTEFWPTIQTMSDRDFDDYVVAVAQQKLKLFNSLYEEADYYWSHIRDGTFEWECWREEALTLRSLTKDDMTKAYKKWLLPGKERHALIVQVIRQGDTLLESSGTGSAPTDPDEMQDEILQVFHRSCKGQLWGRINSKLF